MNTNHSQKSIIKMMGVSSVTIKNKQLKTDEYV
jgi:transposase